MNREDLLLEQWKLASELQRHEDNLSWQKFGYGVAINGALLGAITIGPHENAPALLRLIVPLVGAAVCGAWHLMQTRVALYQLHRTKQARCAEEQLNKLEGATVLSVYREGPEASGLYSIGAQSLISYVPIFFVVAWLAVFVVFLCALNSGTPPAS
jgi:hypothetical protein